MECSIIKKFNGLKLILCVFLLFIFNSSYAAPGCCSHHGGVKGCNTATNHKLCNDGTSSPSCLCSGGTTEVIKKSKTTKTTPASKSSTTTTVTTTATPEATVTNSKTTTVKKTKGCCSRHGGVSGCDATGFAKCKDGSVSSSCKC